MVTVKVLFTYLYTCASLHEALKEIGIDCEQSMHLTQHYDVREGELGPQEVTHVTNSNRVRLIPPSFNEQDLCITQARSIYLLCERMYHEDNRQETQDESTNNTFLSLLRRDTMCERSSSHQASEKETTIVCLPGYTEA